MAIREDLTIDWEASPRIIEVVGTPLTIQDLYDTLRTKAALPESMDDKEIIDGSGKDDLGDGVLVGLTVTLFNAKVRFSAKPSPTVCIISGGNLVAVDEGGDSMSPIAPSENVSVVLAQSTSASIVETGVSGLTQEESDALALIGDIEGGRWKIEGAQMIFYSADNVTEVARFNLLDQDGQPTADPAQAVERRRT